MASTPSRSERRYQALWLPAVPGGAEDGRQAGIVHHPFPVARRHQHRQCVGGAPRPGAGPGARAPTSATARGRGEHTLQLPGASARRTKWIRSRPSEETSTGPSRPRASRVATAVARSPSTSTLTRSKCRALGRKAVLGAGDGHRRGASRSAMRSWVSSSGSGPPASGEQPGENHPEQPTARAPGRRAPPTARRPRPVAVLVGAELEGAHVPSMDLARSAAGVPGIRAMTRCSASLAFAGSFSRT